MNAAVSKGSSQGPQKQVIIIGAGIAGLSAGCYGQMNGYKTRIFEMHDKPGGLCTAWKRKGYTFDGCIEWLTGAVPGSATNRIWHELGAAQGREFIRHEVYQRIEGSDGRSLSLYTNLDRLERHMNELAPEDSDVIGEFCKGARTFNRFLDIMEDPEGPAGLIDGIKLGLRMIPFIGSLRKYSRISTNEFAARFRDPLLRKGICAAVDDIEDMPAMTLMMILAFMHAGDGVFPAGGSLEFARAIERRYFGLDGEIHYLSPVERILVEDDRAVGVRLTDGTEHRADIVISAADGHATIFDMLQGRYVDNKVRGYYRDLPIFPSWIQVSLGVKRDLSDPAQAVTYMLDEPLEIAGEKHAHIRYRHFCYDPSLAPSGKSVLVTMYSSDHAYWQELSREPERYEAEKKHIAAKVIDMLDRRIPGLAEQIEVVDVSTPMTVVRYTGNWQGSQEGWMITTGTVGMVMGKRMDKTLPGLDGFFMCGQWVEPGGGISTSAISGKIVIKAVCGKDKKKFRANLPVESPPGENQLPILSPGKER
jgi:phytoene dehydrogenase-like protein